MPATSEWTAEHPCPGVVVHQPRVGFRYSADAFWLAGFAIEPDATGPPRTALDLGTGSGVVAFLLAAAGWEVRGIDALAAWAPGWTASLRDSGFQPRLEVVDVREVTGRVDVVTCNPPFFPAGAGPISPDPFKAAARTEGSATLADFVHAATRLARLRAVFVVPSDREAELLELAAPFTLVRRLRVGRKRSVLDLRPTGALEEDVALDRDHARVEGFTRLG
ncbi:MAG: hypothetical protein R3F61_15960 [Myxococcota bacterium]